MIHVNQELLMDMQLIIIIGTVFVTITFVPLIWNNIKESSKTSSGDTSDLRESSKTSSGDTSFLKVTLIIVAGIIGAIIA